MTCAKVKFKIQNAEYDIWTKIWNENIGTWFKPVSPFVNPSSCVNYLLCRSLDWIPGGLSGRLLLEGGSCRIKIESQTRLQTAHTSSDWPLVKAHNTRVLHIFYYFVFLCVYFVLPLCILCITLYILCITFCIHCIYFVSLCIYVVYTLYHFLHTLYFFV